MCECEARGGPEKTAQCGIPGRGERISPHYFPVGPCQTRRHREAGPPRQQGASPNHPRSSQRSIPMTTEQRHLTIAYCHVREALEEGGREETKLSITLFFLLHASGWLMRLDQHMS